MTMTSQTVAGSPLGDANLPQLVGDPNPLYVRVRGTRRRSSRLKYSFSGRAFCSTGLFSPSPIGRPELRVAARAC